MGRFFKHWSRFKPPLNIILAFLIALSPVFSKSIKGTVTSVPVSDTSVPEIVSYASVSPSGDKYLHSPLSTLGESIVAENDEEEAINTKHATGESLCGLIDHEVVLPYEEDSLIKVNHHAFDVSDGISPDIMYTVELKVPANSRFIFEYFVTGLPEDKNRTKRRHQRDPDVLELFLNGPSSSTPVTAEFDSLVFCSKSSLGGENRDVFPLLLPFTWFIHGNGIAHSTTSDLSSNVTFRIRYSSLNHSSSFVLEQSVTYLYKPDCSLLMRIESPTRLNLNMLWTPDSSMGNNGLNCTVQLIPKNNFRLEILISDLSIYGMRDICKGRYITFSRGTTISLKSQASNSYQNAPSESPLSPFQRKFCGKLEDYSHEELTFTSGRGSTKSYPIMALTNTDDHGRYIMTSQLNENNANSNHFNSLAVKILLPLAIKRKESFTIDIGLLSPCQKIVLRGLNETIEFRKSANTESDSCSIIIHVPYGYSIITRMVVYNASLRDGEANSEPDFEERGESESESEIVPSTTNSSTILKIMAVNESILAYDNSYNNGSSASTIPPLSTNAYECPVDVEDGKFLVVNALDFQTGSKFRWCFDGSDDSSLGVHKRAWKSIGNKVQLTFQLKYFDVFHLTYQSVNREEMTKDCDQGWVWVGDNHGRCAILVEKELKWTSAEESCQLLTNGHLATIQHEQDEVIFHKIITESALFNPNRGYWIGANDRESEGNFQWTSGLPFTYKNWFMGSTHRRDETFHVQPNNDGWTQDCVEIRQFQNTYVGFSGKHSKRNPGEFRSKGNKSAHPTSGNRSRYNNKFYWNDRSCEDANFYICEKPIQKNMRKDYKCNITIRLNPNQVSPQTVTSPAYPNTYPDNIVCVTIIETVPGYKIVMSFQDFVLEDSSSCNYDALEIREIFHDEHLNSTVRDNPHVKRICGDWTKRLKLLRYKTTTSSSSLSLKFESDFSHHFSGFKASISAEKDVSGQCSDQQMRKFNSYCYLAVSYPAANWITAQDICKSLEGQLASILSKQEWRFISQYLPSTSRYDKKSTFWIGGSIDKNNNLVWSDRMPFNFSAIRTTDMQIISDWTCLTIYWSDGGRKEYGWRLADCSERSGYVCKKKSLEGETRKAVNKTFSGTGGKQFSPNFPSNYPDNLDYIYHLVAPRGTQIVIRFSHLDIEDQEECLYDYVQILDRNGSNSSTYCGTFSSNELERLDYVSSSNEVDLLFHTDFSNSKSGFEIIWRAVDVAGCIAGKTILVGLGGAGFALEEEIVLSPNFPHFNLPNLDCVYTIVAPVGQRIWLTFDLFEMGLNDRDCETQDHMVLDLDGDLKESDGDMNSTEIILCGNLTKFPHRTSYVSLGERVRIRLFSPMGKTGRGFLGKFKAIPTTLVATLKAAIAANTSETVTSINYPMNLPENINVTLAFFCPPNYIFNIHFNGRSSICPISAKSYIEVRDPYHGTYGTSWRLCLDTETSDPNFLVINNKTSDDMNKIVEYNEISRGIVPMNIVMSFRSTFNRMDVRQVNLGSTGRKWSAQLVTMLDENFRAKVLADGDRLLKLDGCMNNPCANGGTCISENGRHICKCVVPFTGPFCGLSLCDLNPCVFGDCVVKQNKIKCVCQLGFGGERCDKRSRPCDEKPCSIHGTCVEVNQTSHQCMCHAWFEGPRCESRMLVIPYKPLSQRVLEEPFWLGLISVTVVLGVIGLVWCLKRHFPEKLDKLLNDDDKNKGISWVSGRSPSFRAGGMRESLPGPSQTAMSPSTSRSWFGKIRKPSLLSLSSASNASVAVVSPQTYENRTFSLDDLLRPSRRMMRTPSPHRRRNYSVQARRDPTEKQQILQQLVSSRPRCSLDGETLPLTTKPTFVEIIQMSERRLRLASASSMQSEHGSIGGDSEGPNTSKHGVEETSFITNAQDAAAIKAEKKVTFARMLDKLTNPDLTSSSSCSDLSCAEDSTKMIPTVSKPVTKKERKGRFRKPRTYHRGMNSETDQDYMDVSSSDTTPDPIYMPRLPSKLCLSPTGTGSSKGRKIPKIASADSLLSLFRKFSGSNSAPPSPQYSENEGESSAVATPLSNPGSPRTSLLSIRPIPPALMITSVQEQNNTIELPVIDPFAQTQGWRAPPTSSITLEVPMRDYCLSPIQEIATPLGTPSHSPCHTPMFKRSSLEHLPFIKVQMSSEEDDTFRSSASSGNNKQEDSSPPKQVQIPFISISADNEGAGSSSSECREDEKSGTGESEVIPDVLINVPPDACLESQPEPESLVHLPRIKHKPCNLNLEKPLDNSNIPFNVILPVVNIEYATPVSEHMQKSPISPLLHNAAGKRLQNNNPSISILDKENPLVPPIITINQISEVESDSDTATNMLLNRPNICFLSPFAGNSDRVASESNLSTSGYSSMASPCPSRCPSVSPLCPSEIEDGCGHMHGQRRSSFETRRSSLTHGLPKTFIPPRRSSFNAPLPPSGLLCDNTDRLYDTNSEKQATKGNETDSAVEIETDAESATPLLKGIMSTALQHRIDDDDKQSSHFSKQGRSKSLGFEVEEGNYVQGGNSIAVVCQISLEQDHACSRDVNLSLGPTCSQSSNGPKLFPLLTTSSRDPGRKCSGNLIEIPEEKEKRLSPASSRSESPLSELSTACSFGFLGSPFTDSDGVYDCGSSEVPLNKNETDITAGGNRLNLLSLKQPNPRRRRRDRRSLRNNQKFPVGVSASEAGETISCTASKEVLLFESGKEELFHGKNPQLSLPPNLAKDLSASLSLKRISAKRRSRAQMSHEGDSSSSSDSSRSRARASWSSLQSSQGTSRINSPQSRSQELGGNERSSPTVQLPEGPSERSVTVGTMDDASQSASPSSSKLPPETNDSRVYPGRKLSRLRTISNQIRFLRRLELSLLRKKECLTRVNSSISEDKRNVVLNDSGSSELSSRCDSSGCSSSCSDSCSECCSCDFEDNDELVLPSSSSTTGRTTSTRISRRNKPSPLQLLDTISTGKVLSGSPRKRSKKH